jgi:hypothetical protein
LVTDEEDGTGSAPKGTSKVQGKKTANPKSGGNQAKKAKPIPVKETSSTSTTSAKKGKPSTATPKSAAKTKAEPKKAAAKPLRARGHVDPGPEEDGGMDVGNGGWDNDEDL